ncbi:MAG: HEAT repeat domain-containing protein, partial [Oligoflexales bacterium]|nr:HEAT repeat domain-containing protein [Oligoflexales bacterium]
VTSYRIEFTSSGDFDPAKILGAQGEAKAGLKYQVALSLKGVISEVTFLENGFLRNLLVDFKGMDFYISINGVKNDEMVKEMMQAMGDGVVLEKDVSGAIKSMRFSERSSGFARNCLKSLLSSMQFVAAPTDKAEIWDSAEYDTLGLFSATYKRDTQNTGTIVKKKRRYLKTHSSLEGMNVVSKMTVHAEGSYHFTFRDKNRYFHNLEGEEGFSYEGVGTHDVLGSSRVRIKAAVDSSGRVADTELPPMMNRMKTVLSSVEPQGVKVTVQNKTESGGIDKTILGELKYSDLLRMSGEYDLLSDEEKANSRSDLFLKLRAFIITSGNDLSALRNDLKNMAAESEAFNLWISAISGAGTPRAQELLGNLISDMSLNASAIEILIPSLGMVDRPTFESEKLMRRLAYESDNQDVMVMASLSLGTICSKLIKGEEDGYDESVRKRIDTIIQDTIRSLEDAEDQKQKSLYLSVLGNIADERVLMPIADHLKDDMEEVRKSAFMALRLIDTPRSLEITMKALREEPSEIVKLSALGSLYHRKLHRPGADQFQDLYNMEKSPAVKKGILDEIAKLGNPESQKLIMDISQNEKEDSLKDYAKKLIKI